MIPPVTIRMLHLKERRLSDTNSNCLTQSTVILLHPVYSGVLGQKVDGTLEKNVQLLDTGKLSRYSGRAEAYTL